MKNKQNILYIPAIVVYTPNITDRDLEVIHMERTYIQKIERNATGIILFLAVCISALLTGIMCRRVDAAAQADMQAHLAQEVLRFHVLANSDSDEDQALKLKVRDAVLEFLEENMPEMEDAAMTAAWMRMNIDAIEEVSRETVASEGAAYPVNAAVTTCWFPDKSYGDVTFPAGNYEALRIEIGAAEGHNWWCVLYPGLCFLDTTNAVVPDEGKQKLKNVLTEEEYSRVTATSDFKISWFFW